MNYSEEYKDVLHYIDSYWDKIIHKPAKKEINHNIITIPYSYITPNDKKFNYIYYWDTYFMFRGLLGTGREWVLKEMVHNFAYLLEVYGIIPNANSPALINRSQPPFFSSMILDTYNNSYQTRGVTELILRALSTIFRKPLVNKKWLKTMTDLAKYEYDHVWTDKDGEYYHRVQGYLLNRYGDRDIGYAHSSELESGWDMTSRFYNRCDEFLPVDLNIFLYKYEKDFATTAKILVKPGEGQEWEKKANSRKKELLKLMWNEKNGFFFDYEYTLKRQSEFWSLSGFTPLWMGIPSLSQAKKMVKNLFKFETKYGLSITSKDSLAPEMNLSKMPRDFRPAVEIVLKPKQWDYPNSWPPLEYLTVIGLLKYEYIDDAVRIMKIYLKTHAAIFRKYKTLFEKVNVETGKPGKDFHYKNQGGFGWTNAIFYRYIQILETLERKEPIYVSSSKTVPHELSIVH